MLRIRHLVFRPDSQESFPQNRLWRCRPSKRRPRRSKKRFLYGKQQPSDRPRRRNSSAHAAQACRQNRSRHILPLFSPNEPTAPARCPAALLPPPEPKCLMAFRRYASIKPLRLFASAALHPKGFAASAVAVARFDPDGERLHFALRAYAVPNYLQPGHAAPRNFLPDYRTFPTVPMTSGLLPSPCFRPAESPLSPAPGTHTRVATKVRRHR